MERRIGETTLTLAADVAAREGIDVELVAASTAPGTRPTIALPLPGWRGGYHGEFVELERAIEGGLGQAAEAGARRVGIGWLGTGEAGFGGQESALVALNTIKRFVEARPEAFDEVRVIVDDDESIAYADHFEDFASTMTG